ncbi:hypothetical protein K402DRAFT_397988, partial [Aulographum hederae CBS 113979]
MTTPATRLQPTEPEDKTRADTPANLKTRLVPIATTEDKTRADMPMKPKTRLVPMRLRNRRQDSRRCACEPCL